MNDLSAFSTAASVSKTSQKPASGYVRSYDWLTERLNHYFDSLERAGLTGYPTQSVLSIHWNRGSSGHKILIRGMSSRDLRTGAAIRALTEPHQEVIKARYGLHHDADGRTRMLRNEENARALRIPLRTFEARLRAARQVLKELLGGNA